MKKTVLFLAVVLVALVVVWYTYFGGEEQIKKIISLPEESKKADVTEFEKKHTEDLITYLDQLYGFNVKYPIGYEAEYMPDFDVYLRFSAHSLWQASEIIDIRVSNSTSAKQGFEEGLKEFNESEVLEKKIIKANGRTAYVIKAKKQFEEDMEYLYLTEAFFECESPEKEAYALALIAVIPEGLLPDQELVDYMVYSLKC